MKLAEMLGLDIGKWGTQKKTMSKVVNLFENKECELIDNEVPAVVCPKCNAANLTLWADGEVWCEECDTVVAKTKILEISTDGAA